RTGRLVEHETIAGVPWEACPPGIGGVCEFTAKPGTRTLLEAVPFRVRVVTPGSTTTNSGSGKPDSTSSGADWNFEPGEPIPLLVTGMYGAGRTAAFASDVAPHWVGGLVDWGTPRRITQSLDSRTLKELRTDGFIEVGADYATFFRNLVRWLAGREEPEMKN
ncbi:MAG: glutamine amidotransferase, partial [Planctomycetia bacterium]|nr:glutamine amidotransferase [Planctomycetia bacterium]